MARATGWAEEKIKWMSLSVLLQYVHAWLIQEGKNTRWVYGDDVEKANVRSQIESIIDQDNDYIAQNHED